MKQKRITIIGASLGLCLLCWFAALVTGDSSDPTPEPTEPVVPVAAVVVQPTLTDTAVPPTETVTPSPTVPTFTATLAGTPGPADCVPVRDDEEIGLVTHVVDGDTIDVEINGQEYRVRYIGMDTPESTNQIEYFGKEATAKNEALVAGKVVRLVKDVSETDRYGRLLRYVFVGRIFVNYELVRSGYATVSTYPPDVACEMVYVDAEAAARKRGVGLWMPEPTATKKPPTQAVIYPTATAAKVKPTATKKVASGNCHKSYPDVCIAPPPPDLDCKDIPFRRFRVLPPDPHNFDGNKDGIGCEG